MSQTLREVPGILPRKLHHMDEGTVLVYRECGGCTYDDDDIFVLLDETYFFHLICSVH